MAKRSGKVLDPDSSAMRIKKMREKAFADQNEGVRQRIAL